MLGSVEPESSVRGGGSGDDAMEERATDFGLA